MKDYDRFSLKADICQDRLFKWISNRLCRQLPRPNSVVRFKLKRDDKTRFYYNASFANVQDEPNLCCNLLPEQVRWCSEPP